MRDGGKRRRVIIITDGDRHAKKTVEEAARRVGGRCISLSAGNPTPIEGHELVDLIKKTPYDPVLIMVDDQGWSGEGKGERILRYVATHPDIEVMGAVAVAANSPGNGEVSVDCSVDAAGEVIEGAVDKDGTPSPDSRLYGDTVGILEKLSIPVIVGTGDTGKMHGADGGSNITVRAIEEILERCGVRE